jgi:myo-inositol-1(or 4)-monophosphatase
VGKRHAEVIDYADLLPVAVAAVDRAQLIITSRQPGVLTAKGERDMASEVDYAVERALRTFLAERTPSVGFLGEEEGGSGSQALRWTLDPVDGTVNFVHGSPLCGVSLALVDKDDPVLGVIDLPFLGSRFTAVKNHGAYAGSQRLRVSAVRSLSDAVVAIGDYAVGVDAKAKNQQRLALTHALTPAVQRIRMHGSAAIDLAWLAAGHVDALVTLANSPWDMSAGAVIAREAGAVLMDRDGSDYSLRSSAILGAAPDIADAVRDLVKAALLIG